MRSKFAPSFCEKKKKYVQPVYCKYNLSKYFSSLSVCTQFVNILYLILCTGCFGTLFIDI